MPDIDLSEYLEESEPPEPVTLKLGNRSVVLPAVPPMSYTLAVGNVVWSQSELATAEDRIVANRELSIATARLVGPLADAAPGTAIVKAVLHAYGYSTPEPSASSDDA